ncbi:MAG: peptide-methionine (S)-S-oxide reductase MsrA [Clostridia bacterium]|nr:peptide-methionine (S)-S-oxide reductase MsrA [Clostridia bacterium]
MRKIAYFAGGCFWCITPFFKMTKGVFSVTAGYSGGEEETPTYKLVKSQKTRHRETIAVDYDDEKVPYTELLDIFLSGVDPYDGEGQFIDRGHSYTLAVYYTSDSEKADAEAMIRALEEASGQKTYIALEPFKRFYPAEEEHQDYYLKNPEAFEEELIASGRKQPQ